MEYSITRKDISSIKRNISLTKEIFWCWRSACTSGVRKPCSAGASEAHSSSTLIGACDEWGTLVFNLYWCVGHEGESRSHAPMYMWCVRECVALVSIAFCIRRFVSSRWWDSQKMFLNTISKNRDSTLALILFVVLRTKHKPQTIWKTYTHRDKYLWGSANLPTSSCDSIFSI